MQSSLPLLVGLWVFLCLLHRLEAGLRCVLAGTGAAGSPVRRVGQTMQRRVSGCGGAEKLRRASGARRAIAARSRLGEHSEVWHSAHFHRWLLAAPHSSPAYQSRHCRPHPAPRRWLAVRAVVGAASRASGARCTTASAAVADVSCKKSKKRFVMCLFTFNNLSQYNNS